MNLTQQTSGVGAHCCWHIGVVRVGKRWLAEQSHADTPFVGRGSALVLARRGGEGGPWGNAGWRNKAARARAHARRRWQAWQHSGRGMRIRHGKKKKGKR